LPFISYRRKEHSVAQQGTKRKSESARRASRTIQLRTLLLLAVFGIGVFALLAVNLYRWQIVRHEELQSLAARQQTMRTTVEATRGTIYDRNMHPLAISATAENVMISPMEIEAYVTAESKEPRLTREQIADGLASILGVDRENLLKTMEKTYSQYEFVKKRVEQEKANEVRAFITEHKLSGAIFLSPTSKRYYPYGSLAANVIGFTNETGGAYGLEAVYNDTLTGESGMVVTAKDVNGRSVLYQFEQYFDAKDGSSLVTTIDDVLQYYLEKGVGELEARFGTGKGATGIIMDVNTGAILAMASLPTYDLNSPGALYNDFLTRGMSESAVLETITELRYRQWRNKAINDTYQPGSTFKILTLSMGLEEGVIDLNSIFHCAGHINMEGFTIYCSNHNGHGQQSLTVATGNSCNPAFINIGLRIGNEKFYNYMKAFGLTEPTGIDTTGEASGFVNKEITYSTLALACYAFGQNFNVTPVALIAAQAACINGGYLRTPYLVDQVLDGDGNVVFRHDSTPIRQVISEETSATVRGILEYVVDKGTGKNGKVAGYRIGGKTGTADKVGGNVIVSFVSFAPADDPQIIMLLTLDEPAKDTGTYVSGGNMAAPISSSIMADVLPYLGIEPNYSAEELVGADAPVPNLVGEKRDDAIAKLKELGFGVRTVGNGDTVTDQTPLGGAIVPNNADIILYLGAEKSNEPCIVPNVIGDRASVANQKLTNAGLIMAVSGATNASSATVRAISQSEEPGREVPPGTVVRVQLSDSSVTD